MLEVLRNSSGNITAVCEWLPFNERLEIDQNGTVVFIGELEINKEHRGNGVFKKILRKVYDKNPQALVACWYRNIKYPDRGMVKKTRSQIERQIGV